MTSLKTIETTCVIERDVDTDAYAVTQREKENTCVIQASRESNFVTDNRRFRKKSGAKKELDEYAQDKNEKIICG